MFLRCKARCENLSEFILDKINNEGEWIFKIDVQNLTLMQYMQLLKKCEKLREDPFDLLVNAVKLYKSTDLKEFNEILKLVKFNKITGD